MSICSVSYTEVSKQQKRRQQTNDRFSTIAMTYDHNRYLRIEQMNIRISLIRESKDCRPAYKSSDLQSLISNL